MSARVTPYEMILESFEHDAFPAIRAEAEQRGRDPRNHDDFMLLGLVGATLASMIADDAPPEALDQYGELLWQGFRFWSTGRRIYAFDEMITERLTAPQRDLGQWELAAPPAAYLQFPYQRVWTRVVPDAPYEPVDGCFVASNAELVSHGEPTELRLLLVLGLRADRPGVSLVLHRVELDPGDAPRLARAPWRDSGNAFANTMPGGERKGLRTLITEGELEALVLRALHVLDTQPRVLVPRPGGSATPGESRLPHVDVYAELPSL
ncbi:MAG TPA: hypothetical protein VIC55_12110 [Gemmatimonadaceae bacterium]